MESWDPLESELPMGYKYARIFGRNINDRLNAKDILLDEFAEYMGYTMTEVTRLIDGNLLVTINDMNKIADFLGVKISELGKIK